MLKKISLIFLFFIISFQFVNAGLVYFANIKQKQVGFIAKYGEEYYAFTSQAALLSLGRFALKNFDGTTINTTGPLELSYYSDAARIKVDPGVMKDQAFEIGGKVSLGEEVQVYSISIEDNVDAKSPDSIDGVGMYSFAVCKETDNDSAGAPVLNAEGKVLGVISLGYKEFEITPGWGEEKIKVVERKNKFASRLDVEAKWVPAEKAGFQRAGGEITSAAKFQAEFLPLLNFWCENPYRELPEYIEFPKELKSWVRDHNYKTKAYDRLIPKCAKNPSEKKGLIHSVMTGTLERSRKISKFPQNKVRQMQIAWKTSFLKSRAKIYLQNWHKVNKMMELRLVNMEYMPPYFFTKKKKESK